MSKQLFSVHFLSSIFGYFLPILDRTVNERQKVMGRREGHRTGKGPWARTQCRSTAHKAMAPTSPSILRKYDNCFVRNRLTFHPFTDNLQNTLNIAHQLYGLLFSSLALKDCTFVLQNRVVQALCQIKTSFWVSLKKKIMTR